MMEDLWVERLIAYFTYTIILMSTHPILDTKNICRGSRIDHLWWCNQGGGGGGGAPLRVLKDPQECSELAMIPKPVPLASDCYTHELLLEHQTLS